MINSIIGAGIFGLPSRVFALAGTYSLFAYLLSAVAIGFVILCFAEVGSRFSATGGPYLYARATFGPLIGFQVGWLMWLGRMAGLASLCNLFMGYVGFFAPVAGTGVWRSFGIVAVISTLAVANIVGIRMTATLTNTLTVGKLVPLFLLVVAGAFAVDAGRYSIATLPTYGSFSQAALLLVFTYMGFEGAAIPSGEMHDPARHLPFALIVGVSVVTLVYMSVQLVCIGTLPELAHSDQPLVDAAHSFLGAPGASLIGVGALVSIGGTLNALMFATPRLLFAMGENRQIARFFSSTHPYFRTPVVAILLTATMTLALALSSTFISALTLSVVVRLLAYMTTCAALPVLRRRPEFPHPAFVVSAGTLIAVAAVGLSVWLLTNSPWTEMQVAVIAVLLGFVLYLPCRWMARERPAPAEPGRT